MSTFGKARCLLNRPATTGIYTLSLHDALPVFQRRQLARAAGNRARERRLAARLGGVREARHGRLHRSEEHTTALQAHVKLVCRLSPEKTNNVVSINDGEILVDTTLFITRNLER